VNYRKRKKESKRERDLKGESESAGEAQKQRQIPTKLEEIASKGLKKKSHFRHPKDST
jgi:hypothetical protein